jgi:hypothetical protein
MKSQTESRLSGLLTAEENAAVLNMIGARAQPLATTVAQVPSIIYPRPPFHMEISETMSCLHAS